MNNEQKGAPDKAPEIAPNASKGGGNIRYSLATLRPHSVELFGVSGSTFAGATSALDESKTYSKDEIKKVISEWLKKEVK